MRRVFWLASFASFASLASVLAAGGCTGNVFQTAPGGSGGTGATGAGGTGTGATGTGGSGTGGAGAAGGHGDCASTADCDGLECLEIVPGGFKVCAEKVVEATTCGAPTVDECCTTEECMEGKCLVQPVVPSCGGAVTLDFNACSSDLCAGDDECSGGACLPAPMMGRKVRACFYTACRLDTDCMAEPGGMCAPVADSCCGAFSGLYCVYPSDGCRFDADCLDGFYCQPGLDRTSCVHGVPTCPA